MPYRILVLAILILLGSNPVAAQDAKGCNNPEVYREMLVRTKKQWDGGGHVGFNGGPYEFMVANRDRTCNEILAEKAEKQRKLAEAKEAEARAKEADEKKADAIRSNPKVMSLVIGTELCLAQTARQTAVDEIAKQKKYARIGGVVNRVSLYQLQNRVRLADEFMQKERTLLKTAPNLKHVTPLPCSNAMVKQLSICKIGRDLERPECKAFGPDVELLLQFVPTIDDDYPPEDK